MPTEQRFIDDDICEIEAKAVIPGATMTLECLITDISDEGARIEVDPAAYLPPFFKLALPVTSALTDERLVELRWRLENMAGLRFVGPTARAS